MPMRLPSSVYQFLDEKDKKILNEVEKTISADVDKAIDEFRDKLMARASKYAAGDYDSELQHQADTIVRQLQSDLSETETQFSNLAKSAKEIETAINQTNISAETLSGLTTQLLQDSKALEDRLAEYKKKLEKAGSTTGRLLAQGITKVLTAL
jgi:chromosome segregation ATPase